VIFAQGRPTPTNYVIFQIGFAMQFLMFNVAHNQLAWHYNQVASDITAYFDQKPISK
jgi:hypothetical protein